MMETETVSAVLDRISTLIQLITEEDIIEYIKTHKIDYGPPASGITVSSIIS
jgi:hypothetical protein